jgi:Na+/H+-dicarboxylate symporter
MESAVATAGVSAQISKGILDVVMGIVPENILKAAVDNKILGLVLFCMLFGFFLGRIEEPFKSAVLNFWQGVFRVIILMTNWVMWLAPVGVFALAARAVSRSGLEAAGPLIAFSLCVVAALRVYSLVAIPLIVRVTTGLSPLRLFSAMGPALLTAFSTASSSASLPITLECAQRRAGVSERITCFVLPLGASINHAGSAIYEFTAVIFIAQAYGVVLPVATQLAIVGLILVVTMGVGGVPAASLVGIAVVLAAIGLPTEAIGILLIVDRLLDMCRTAVNVLANAACTAIVARREGESGILGS